jgi:hypothetical protein
MEVSTLRDRRLVAVFATVMIVGAGAAAAVVSLDHGAGRRGLGSTEAAFAPAVPEPGGTPDLPPVIVAVVVEEPPAAVPGGAGSSTHVRPAPAPASDPCGGADAPSDGPRGAKTKTDCAKPPKPEPGEARVVKADAGPAPRPAPRPHDVVHDVVIASDPDPDPRPPRPPEPAGHDDEGPKPRPAPKPGPSKGKGGH